MKIRVNISDIFEEARRNETYLKICAPMVRYSKVEFRTLVRKYKTDLCFTPMIMADSFCQSQKARLNEFTTNHDDTTLIAQFAAKNVNDYLSATEMIYPYVDGVDLNCGCPQRWAMQDGYGSALLKDPELIADLVKSIKRTLPNNFSVSIKIRILNDKSLSSTIDLARQIEKCGVDFITLHGRTPAQKTSTPVDVAAIREVRESLSIPLIANGDIRSLLDADIMFSKTGCAGVMAARGILSNPGMYAGYSETPLECVQNWLNIAAKADDNITFQCFHHHLTFMTEQLISKKMRVHFNNLTTKQQVFSFFEENYQLIPNDNIPSPDYIVCEYDETNFRNRKKELKIKTESESKYCSETSKGSYFTSKIEELQADTANNENDLFIFDASLFD